LRVLQALIAAARFVAKVEVLLLVTKVPLVEPVHVCEPSLPPLTLPHETLVTVVPTERAEAPSNVEVTFTLSVLLPVRCTPVRATAGKFVLQEVIAAAK